MSFTQVTEYPLAKETSAHSLQWRNDEFIVVTYRITAVSSNKSISQKQESQLTNLTIGLPWTMNRQM